MTTHKSGFERSIEQIDGYKLLLTAVLIAVAAYGVYQHLTFAKEREQFEADKAQLDLAVVAFQDQISSLEEELEELEEEKEELEEEFEEEQERIRDALGEFDDLTDTVDDLKKLSETDEELLQKYSKVAFLNEHYIPSRLKDIDEDYLAAGVDDQQIHAEVLPFLEDLLEDAEDDDVELLIRSAYRSFGTQSVLKSNYLVTYGSGANAFSADQGFSEHQLGTAVDFTNTIVGGQLVSGFANTESYEWLLDNAHKHGFVLSYPENNAFYIFEPWHWRFVGEDLAKDLDRDDAFFYDWDQRDIDEYLLDIFD